MADTEGPAQFKSVEEELAAATFEAEQAKQTEEQQRLDEQRLQISHREAEAEGISQLIEQLRGQIEAINQAMTAFHGSHSAAVDRFNAQWEQYAHILQQRGVTDFESYARQFAGRNELRPREEAQALLDRERTALTALIDELQRVRDDLPHLARQADPVADATEHAAHLETRRGAILDEREQLIRETPEGQEALRAELVARIAERHQPDQRVLRRRILTGTSLLPREDVAELSELPRDTVEAAVRSVLHRQLDSVYQQVTRAVDPRNVSEVAQPSYVERIDNLQHQQEELRRVFLATERALATALDADEARRLRMVRAHGYGHETSTTQAGPELAQKYLGHQLMYQGYLESEFTSIRGQIDAAVEVSNQLRYPPSGPGYRNAPERRTVPDLAVIEERIKELVQYLINLPALFNRAIDQDGFSLGDETLKPTPPDWVKRGSRSATIEEIKVAADDRQQLVAEQQAAGSLLDLQLAVDWAAADVKQYEAAHPKVQYVESELAELARLQNRVRVLLDKTLPAVQQALKDYGETKLTVRMDDRDYRPGVRVDSNRERLDQVTNELNTAREAVNQLRMQVSDQGHLVATASKGLWGIGGNLTERSTKLQTLQQQFQAAEQRRAELQSEYQRLYDVVATVSNGLKPLMDAGFNQAFRALDGSTLTVNELSGRLTEGVNAELQAAQVSDEQRAAAAEYQSLVEHQQALARVHQAANQEFRRQFNDLIQRTENELG